METKNGTVTAISKRVVKVKGKNQDAYSLKIGDGWYSGFGTEPCMKGDIIAVEYEVNGNFNNIKKVVSVTQNMNNANKKPEETPPKPTTETPIMTTNESIMKQVALKSAVELAKIEGNATMDGIIKEADIMYKWLRG